MELIKPLKHPITTTKNAQLKIIVTTVLGLP